jgi:hypothetical protein
MKKIIAISLIIISCNGLYAQSKEPPPPIKTYPVSFNQFEWQRKMDTLSYLVGNFGKTLTVSEAEVWIIGANKVLNSFANQIREQMAKDTLPASKPKK